jgi:hypothetical protein
MRMYSILLSLFMCLLPAVSHANVLLKLSGLYQSDSSGQGTMSTTSRTLMDFGGYWVSQKGWLVGGLYGSDKTAYTSGSLERTSYGPSFGWLTRKESGPFVIATYHYSAKLTQNSTGSGYQFDLGYKFDLRRVGLGLQLSYKHFDFNKAGNVTITPPYKSTQIDPYVSLLIEF